MDFTLDASAFEALRSTIATYAPDLLGMPAKVEPAKVESTKAKKKPLEVPGRRDQYVQGATPQIEQDEEVSSVRRRERKGNGLSAHELLLQQKLDPESLLPQEEEADLRSEEAILAEKDGGLAEHELCEGEACGEHYELAEMREEDPHALSIDDDIREQRDEDIDLREPDSNDGFYEEAYLHQERVNGEAVAANNGTRNFAREEDLWNQRYRHDYQSYSDQQGSSSRHSQVEADRRRTEQKLRDQQLADDLARQRIDEDRYRR